MGIARERGALIAGRYRLGGLLGRGGMGEVWAATHRVTERRVALKFLTGARDASADARRRFEREARAASRVEHPNVVTVHDFFELDDGTPIMVLDLLEGETLAALLEREGVLSIERVAEIMLPVVSAVGTAHARAVVHRDLKPDNIFLTSGGPNHERVKVLDFGIAKLREPNPPVDQLETATGQPLGTPSYMAPEQCLGESVTHAADVWSLGVVLYEALSGELPVEAKNFGQLVKRLLADDIAPLDSRAPEVPADVSELVMRMLSREPEWRPELDEVAAVLGQHTEIPVPSFGMATTVPAPSGDDDTEPVDASESSGGSEGAERPAVVVVGDAASDPEAETQQQTSASFALEQRADAGAATPARKARVPTWLVLVAALAGIALFTWSFGQGPAPDATEPAASGQQVETAAEPSFETTSVPPPALEPSDMAAVDSSADSTSEPLPSAPAPRAAPRAPRPPKPEPTASAQVGSPYGDEPGAATSPATAAAPAPTRSAPPPTSPKVIPTAPF